MCIYIYNIHMYTHTHLFIYIYTYIRKQLYIYIYIYIYTYVFTCVWMCVCVCVHTCTKIHAPACVRAVVSGCTCVFALPMLSVDCTTFSEVVAALMRCDLCVRACVCVSGRCFGALLWCMNSGVRAFFV